MKRSIVWRLMRRNISVGQLVGYAVANLVGLAIVVSALQLYRDVTAVWESDDSFISRDYLIISKTVEGVQLGPKHNEFTAEEIAEIEQQPWIRKVGQFSVAGFNVSASLDMWGRGMSTALFLEAIPDEFFDVKPYGWEWNPTPGPNGLPEVPIIISKDYLTLYNFGFATSRGYPQLSEATIGQLPLRLSVAGNGRQMTMTGRIVGFSSRLNTFAVPQTFLDWANGQLAEPGSDTNPSRLILEVNTPGDPAIGRFLAEKGYESAGDKADNGRAAYFLQIITAIVVAVGIVISLLAFFILLLSIHLLIQKNRRQLHMLMMLGYTPGAVARYYYIIICVLNTCVLVGAWISMLIARHLWSGPLSEIGVEGTGPWMSMGIGLLIMALITVGNITAIRRNIGRTFPGPHRSSQTF
ncbi:MAG: ABC transporter permease [Bacteroides sp.]|nr:ABC transporter permease [Bacteroides sp.]MCM1413964.1 ABC transporter permease [Bacteroides sp.]MCM1471819.1 ABC transporter permease [Bacteroides sp.]